MLFVDNLFIFLFLFWLFSSFGSWEMWMSSPWQTILFQISPFIFLFFGNLCYLWFGCVVILLLLLCGSFRWDCFCFSVFGVSIIVLGSCCFVFLFTWCIYNVSRPENEFFFIIVFFFTCLKTSDIWNFYNSFLIPSLCRVDPKITVKCKFVVFSSNFSMLVSLVCYLFWGLVSWLRIFSFFLSYLFILNVQLVNAFPSSLSYCFVYYYVHSNSSGLFWEFSPILIQ